MEDNVVEFKRKQGNANVDLSQLTTENLTEEIKKIVELSQISVKDLSYNIRDLSPYRVSTSIKQNKEGDNMSNSEYVTEKELKALEDRLEQKITHNQEILAQKLETTKNEINLKLDNQILQFKSLIDTKFNEHREKQVVNNRWLITTVIATAGVLFTFLKLFH